MRGGGNKAIYRQVCKLNAAVPLHPCKANTISFF